MKGEDGGQSYLISVSDMMCGLLFLFIITLMVFVINFHVETLKKTEALEQATRNNEHVAEKLRSLASDYRKKTQELTHTREARAQLLEEVKAFLEKQGLQVYVDQDQGVLRLPEKILFPLGSADLQAEGKENLRKLALALRATVPCYAGSHSAPRPPTCSQDNFRPGTLEAILIEGHTDNVPIREGGQFKNNWELSAKRSIVTYLEMLRAEPTLADLKNPNAEPLLGVSAYAETRPIVRHEKEAPEPLNRRIDLRFLMAPPSPERIELLKEVE
ncbi:MAG: OmpA/MotB family protein [Desulfosoma sp.]|uniref:OmpA/MotB family protein n=1 Tax=Desulfosoma sp. TaxID=2603217 RepID=UPI004049DF71